MGLSAEDFLEGQVLLFDKELNWTSFDVVNKLRVSLRNILGIRKIKVGHAGTLDPLATGLVILCTGKATKRLDSFHDLEKEYVAELTLGSTTPSFDRETEIDQTFPTDHITEAILQETLLRFTGEMDQTPPIYSAKQVDGKRAYTSARQGQHLELKTSRITIYENALLAFTPPTVLLRVTCSKGTYIRSLANDIGKALGSGAHLSGLRRTRIGEYHVTKAEKIENFLKKLKPL